MLEGAGGGEENRREVNTVQVEWSDREEVGSRCIFVCAYTVHICPGERGLYTKSLCFDCCECACSLMSG